MKKTRFTAIALAVVLIFSVLLTACGSQNTSAPETNADTAKAPSSDEVYNLRCTIGQGPTSAVYQALSAWAKGLEEESNGRLKIDIYHSAQLASVGDTLDFVASGGADLAWSALPHLSHRVPSLDIIAVPSMGQYNSLQGAAAVQHIIDKYECVQEEIAALGIHLLAVNGTGVVALSCTSGRIESEADFSGLKVRAPNAVYNNIVTAMGAATMSCGVTELYENLSKNVIQANLTDMENITGTKSYELLDSVMAYSWGSPCGFVYINTDKYNSLPADLQELLDSKYDELSKDMSTLFNTTLRDEFFGEICKEESIDVYKPNDEMVARIEELDREMNIEPWIQSMNEKGLDGEAMFADYQAIYEEAHTEYGADYDWFGLLD